MNAHVVENLPMQCPYCGYDGGTHTALSGQTGLPTPGEFSICSECGEVATFAADDYGTLYFRRANEQEAELHLRSPEVAFARTLIQLNRALVDANTKRE